MTKTSEITTSRWFWVALLLAVVAVAGGAGADIVCIGDSGQMQVCV